MPEPLQTICDRTLQEWLNSGVDKSLITLNVRDIEGDNAYQYLLYGKDVPRRNDGRIRDNVYRKYRHVEDGLWWCSGVDPLQNYEPMEWGVGKPFKPRRNPEKNTKYIKYEHPYRVATRAFLLAVPDHIWELVAAKSAIAISEEDKNHPHGFWGWVWRCNVPLIVCEGAKKAGALLTAGYAAIALPGVNGGYRLVKDDEGQPTGERCLIPDILHFAIARRNITICFDNDDKPETVQRVNAAINSFSRLLVAEGCTVNVTHWDYPEKGIDDLIVAHGVHTADEVIQSALNLEQWQVRGYSELSHVPDVTLNQRYLGAIEIPKNAKLVCLRAPKGTGKTEALTPIVADAIDNGQPVILLSHRVQLAQAISDRVGIPYITEVRESETGALLGYGLCVDSLHPTSQARFNADQWKQALVIIDEVEQVIWHLLTAATEIKKHRTEVIRQLSQLLKNSLAPGRGKVILADADLSNLSIDFVKGLAKMPEVNPWIVLNEWQGTKWKIRNYDQPNPGVWLKALETEITAGGKPFICLDGQKAKSKWGTKVLEAYLRKLFPHLRILRVDSESIADPTHPAYGCISCLNDLLLAYDIVLVSPSLGTGVSIDIRGYFTSVWGCFQGVTAENSARQALARVREELPRHVWLAKRGLGSIGNGAISLKSLLASEHKKFQANLQQLQAAGMSIGEDIDTNHTALNIWGKMACRINAGMKNYRQSVLDGLIAEGHEFFRENDDFSGFDAEAQDDTSPGAVAVVKNLKTTKEEIYSEECEAIAKVDISQMTPADYEKLNQQRAKTQAERYQEKKYNLAQRYGVEITPELVAADDDGYYGQLRWHYFLTAGREFVSSRDRALGEKMLESKAAWLPDFNGGQRGLFISSLELLGIDKIIANGQELRASDELLVKMATNAKSVPWQMKLIFNVTVTNDDTPIEILGRLLKRLGLTLDCIGRDGTGERHRIYQVIGEADGRRDIFHKWLERDIQKLTLVSGSVQTNYASTSILTSTETVYIDKESVNGRTDKLTDVNQRNSQTLIGQVVQALGLVPQFLVQRLTSDGQALCRNLVNGLDVLLSVDELTPVAS